ncbi:MAG: DUF429 domain-containing protein [Dehalococcoidia bacterium]
MSVAKPAADASSATPVLGVDLRSGPRYPTGLAILGRDRRLRALAVVRTDEEIEAAVARWRPALIAIDAPLALPEGRCCADPTCECARFGIYREIDRLCARLGYRPFPTLLPSMVKLTLRGSALCERLLAAGEHVAEVYPGMVQDILGIPRKQAGLGGLARGLRRAGVRGLPRSRRVTHDELDAVTCALAALLHLEGRAELLGPGVPVPFIAPLAPSRFPAPVP